MVQISAKVLKVLKIVIIITISITIVSLIANYLIYANGLTRKESMEKLKGVPSVGPNKDAYQFARFIAGIGVGLGVGARLLGIYATLTHSFIHTLIYAVSLIVLLLCYAIGVVRMSIFDTVLHVLLILLASVFAKIIAKEEPFSKEVATLPL